MAEWLKATDCKSVHASVRRFEPYSAHSSFKGLTSSKNIELLNLVFAEVAHLVER